MAVAELHTFFVHNPNENVDNYNIWLSFIHILICDAGAVISDIS